MRDTLCRVTDGLLRIAVLTPHTAAGPEVELPAMAPMVTVTRVLRVSAVTRGSTDPSRTTGGGGPPPPDDAHRLAEPPTLDDAARRLASTSDAVAFGSTSTGYSIGYHRELALEARLTGAAGVPVVSTCTSAISGLRALDVDRIALVNPPWFDDEVNDLGVAYFRGAGVDVTFAASADLVRDPALVETSDVVEWTAGNVPATAGAVFVGGNGFRAAGAIRALEARIGCPVLTSNQVLLWALLAHLPTTGRIEGYGELFAHDYPTAA
jgi:maleate isomerase